MSGLDGLAADLTRLRRHWDGALDSMKSHLAGAAESSTLEKIARFGDDPGRLEMFVHVPDDLPPAPALVVALHGCGQNAAGYDEGAGWSTLADRYGFVLLLPQQSSANNHHGCFNWYQPEDTTRGSGEVASVRSMIAHAVARYGIAPDRVFVAGLSAGGALAGAMLATYPELFAGGAIVAGLPYRAAGSVREAMDCMFKDRPRAAEEWGDLVRSASPHRGPWPRVSIWHGDADHVVRAHNAVETLKQWTDVHGVGRTPHGTTTVDGFPREVWRDPTGREVIESYTIPGMGHGVPLAIGDGDENAQCGAAGPYMLDVGISSSYHIAAFWGLTGAAATRTATARPTRREASAGAFRESTAGPARPETVRSARPETVGSGAAPGGLEGEVLPPGRDGQAGDEPRRARAKPKADDVPDTWWEPGRFTAPDRLADDVMGVIRKALKTAGLR